MAEMFLKLDGVLGESLDSATPKSHANEIEIRSWNWLTKNIVRWDINQGGQSTKVTVQDIILEKTCDRATPTLYQCCVTGKHIASGTITCRKNDGDSKVEYMILTLKDIMISRVELQGDGESSSLKETIELSFAEFHIDYKVQQESGDAAGSTTFAFNIQKQAKT